MSVFCASSLNISMSEWINFDQILETLTKILEKLEAIHRFFPNKAHRIILALPEIHQGDKLMANLQLKNDQVMTIGILTVDNMGTIVPAPVGDVYTVVSSLPASLNAVIGATAAGGPAVVLNALVEISPGLSFTVSDSAGLEAFTENVDIVEDFTPSAVGLDIADATSVAQALPTAPGP